MLRLVWVLVVASQSVASGVVAQDLRLTEDRTEARMQIGGAEVMIARRQGAGLSQVCPPACLQPIAPAPGIVTLGELELIGFLQTAVAAGTGVLIDSRLPQDAATGAIPAAVNVPYVTLAPNNPFRDTILTALGGSQRADGSFDFSTAMQIAFYCDGPSSDASPRAIRLLVEAGYPADKLKYYRGGMQDWRLFGLTVVALPAHREEAG